MDGQEVDVNRGWKKFHPLFRVEINEDKLWLEKN
jgi:hypothetical protein